MLARFAVSHIYTDNLNKGDDVEIRGVLSPNYPMYYWEKFWVYVKGRLRAQPFNTSEDNIGVKTPLISQSLVDHFE